MTLTIRARLTIWYSLVMLDKWLALPPGSDVGKLQACAELQD